MNSPDQKRPDELSDEEISHIKGKTQSLMAITLLLFFFGLPAACFGCASMYKEPGAIVFPAAAVLGILGSIVAWGNQRSKLPEGSKSTFAVVVMVAIVLGVLGFVLVFGSLMGS